MEICQQLIDRAELVAGLDEDVGFRRAGLKQITRCIPALFRGRARRGVLQGAHDRRSHGEDGPRVAPRVADRGRRLLGNFIALRMDLVLLDFFLMNGLERSEPYFQRDGGDFDRRALLIFSRIAGEKCSPAVGAATAPGWSAKIVW